MSDNSTQSEAAIFYMGGGDSLPRENGELVFHEPWEGRAFGLAVVMHQNERYTWDEFRNQLIDEIERSEDHEEDSTYYEHWLRSLEKVSLIKGFVTEEEIQNRAALLASDEYDDHQE